MSFKTLSSYFLKKQFAHKGHFYDNLLNHRLSESVLIQSYYLVKYLVVA